MKKTLTDLWGNQFLQNDLMSTFCEIETTKLISPVWRQLSGVTPSWKRRRSQRGLAVRPYVRAYCMRCVLPTSLRPLPVALAPSLSLPLTPSLSLPLAPSPVFHSLPTTPRLSLPLAHCLSFHLSRSGSLLLAGSLSPPPPRSLTPPVSHSSCPSHGRYQVAEGYLAHKKQHPPRTLQ